MSILSDSILLESLEDMDVEDMSDTTVGDYIDAEEGIPEVSILDDIGDEDMDDDPMGEENFDDDDELIDDVVGGDYS